MFTPAPHITDPQPTADIYNAIAAKPSNRPAWAGASRALAALVVVVAEPVAVMEPVDMVISVMLEVVMCLVCVLVDVVVLVTIERS